MAGLARPSAARARVLLARLDARVAQVEQHLIVAMLLAMTAAMAAAVLHRVLSRPEGRLSTWLLRLAAALGVALDPATVHGPVSNGLNILLTLVICWLALRRHHAPPRALAWAVVATVATTGAVAGLLAWAPEGIVWAPAAALTCLLWTGMLGASLAAQQGRHLSLEFADRLWPARWQPAVRRGAAAVAALTCAALALLAAGSLLGHLAAWQLAHDADLLVPTRIPTWLALLVVPYGFLMMALRFLAHACTAPVAR